MKVIENLNFNSTNNGNFFAYTTLRGVNGGSAANNYSCFNICDYTGDSVNHVELCRQELCRQLEITPSHLIMPRQTHTANVAIINREFLALDQKARTEYLQDIDALVTNLPNVAIGVNTADCVPIVLRDATTGVAGVAHAGWKGTIMHIGAKTVEAMLSIGASINNIEAIIGVSICPNCFEVGDEVVAQFAEAGFPTQETMPTVPPFHITPIPKSADEFVSIIHRNAMTGKAHIDLWQANALTLMKAGINADKITISGKCTHCNPSRYFSARRLGIHSGRTFTTILRKE